MSPGEHDDLASAVIRQLTCQKALVSNHQALVPIWDLSVLDVNLLRMAECQPGPMQTLPAPCSPVLRGTTSSGSCQKAPRSDGSACQATVNNGDSGIVVARQM